MKFIVIFWFQTKQVVFVVSCSLHAASCLILFFLDLTRSEQRKRQKEIKDDAGKLVAISYGVYFPAFWVQQGEPSAKGTHVAFSAKSAVQCQVSALLGLLTFKIIFSNCICICKYKYDDRNFTRLLLKTAAPTTELLVLGHNMMRDIMARLFTIPKEMHSKQRSLIWDSS